MRKKKSSNATLSWKLEDYRRNKEEAPQRIKDNPTKTEGEMMSDEEIEDWFAESFKVLEILKEEDTGVFRKIHKGFIEDLTYLYSLGRIDEDVIIYVKEINNFDF